MKASLLILVLSTSYLLSSAQKSEPLLISGEYVNVALSDLLRDLGKTYQIDFAYDSKAFRNRQVTISFKKQALAEVLDTLLQPLDLDFAVVNETYIIYPSLNSYDESAGQDPKRRNFNYTGRVVDQRDLVPLPFATVTTFDGKKSAISNEQGYFTLTNLSSDTISIQVRYLGYLTKRVRLTSEFVSSESPIELIKDNAILPLVTIYGQYPDIIELGILGEGESIDMETIRYLPNAGEPDVLRTLQMLPGVSSSGESAADLHVRGGASDENLVILDGFTLYHLDHFFGIFSAFNSNSLKHAVLHKGVFDARFGGRASSVLELSGKQGNFVQPESSVELGLLASNLLLESPILGRRASLMISARRSYTDIAYSPLYKSMFNNLYNGSVSSAISGQTDVFGQPESPDFSFYDLAAKLGFETREQTKYTFSFFRGKDQLRINYRNMTLDERFDLQYNDQSSWGNTGVSGRVEKQWKNGDFAELLLSYSVYNSELFGFDSTADLLLGAADTAYFDHNTQVQDITLFAEQNLIRGEHTISFGTEIKRFDLNASILETDAQRTEDQFNKLAISVFGQDTYRPFQSLLLKAGLRLTGVTGVGNVLIEPRLLFEYEVKPTFRLTGGLGINNQFIRRIRRQNLFQNSADEWAFAGENNLPVLSADHFTMGTKIDLNHWTIALNGYYANKTGVVEDARVLTGLSEGTFENDLLVGTGNAIGLESTFAYSRLRHHGWVSYTISNAQNQFDEQGLGTLRSSFDVLHELNAVYMYKLRNWHFSSTLIFGSGRPFTASPGTYTLELINGVEQERVAFSTVNGSRLPSYERIDMAVNYDMKIGNAVIHTGAGVFNLLNRQNVANRQYYLTSGMDESISLAVRDLTHLGITPTIRIGVSW